MRVCLSEQERGVGGVCVSWCPAPQHMCVSSGLCPCISLILSGPQELGGAGGGGPSGRLWGLPRPSPCPTGLHGAAFQEGPRGVGAGEAEAAKAAGRCPINPACALASHRRGSLRGLPGHAHTRVLGQWDTPASSPPTAPGPHCWRVREEPQTLRRVPAKLLSGAGTWALLGCMGLSWHCQPGSDTGTLCLSPRVMPLCPRRQPPPLGKGAEWGGLPCGARALGGQAQGGVGQS